MSRLLEEAKPLDTAGHFGTRFVHKYVPVDEVKANGGTVVNIHHANAINPYINYPFFNLDAQKAYINEAHAKGVKVKLEQGGFAVETPKAKASWRSMLCW